MLEWQAGCDLDIDFCLLMDLRTALSPCQPNLAGGVT
jgi:hypothetical protein